VHHLLGDILALGPTLPVSVYLNINVL
jgi:hypothetical protein